MKVYGRFSTLCPFVVSDYLCVWAGVPYIPVEAGYTFSTNFLFYKA